MTRRYRMARPEEHRALMVQDARAFGDSTTSVSIDRSVARTRVEELRVLEEDGVRLGLLLARAQPVFRGGRPVRWMARVVDVPGAFAARGYPSWLRGRITIGVADDTCPWVDGTWTVEVDGGEGKAVRVGDDAQVTTTAAGLAALFAGYHDPSDLAVLGVVRGLDPAAVEFLQAMHAGPRPWSPDFY